MIGRFVNTSCQRITFLALGTLALESKNTLILESNMTPALGSMVWISMWCWDVLVSTLLNEKGSEAVSASST